MSLYEAFLLMLLFTIVRPLVVIFWKTTQTGKFFKKNQIYRPISESELFIKTQNKRENLGFMLTVVVDVAVMWSMYALGLFGMSSDFTIDSQLIISLSWQIPFHFIFLEFTYYWYHRFQHQYPWLYKYHRYHHLSVVTTPKTSMSFNFWDRLGLSPQFILPFIAINFITQDSISPWLFIIMGDFNDLVNIAGHINYEIMPKWWAKNKVLNKILYTTTHHALHHSKFRYNYSLFCPFFDLIFKTDFRETEEIYDLIKEKQNPLPISFSSSSRVASDEIRIPEKCD